MSGPDRWNEVDEYISDRLVGADPDLAEALAESARAGLPPIAVSAPQGKLLYLTAVAIGARRILEIGTLGGYSTIWLARALRPNPAADDPNPAADNPNPAADDPNPAADSTDAAPATPAPQVITLELEAKHAQVARANVDRAGVGDLVDIRVGPALDSLPKLAEEGLPPFDLAFIDADKDRIPTYFDWCVRLSRPGAVIITDNVVRNGALIDPASEDGRILGVRRFHELLAGRRDVEATTIQTVGAKGYDGFNLAVVRG
ncbi:MAG TPA: O-methyltransferase [Acidimicrobiales bacterium]|nr:O-methyltransferase [Acidimicrobiales bacterium]